MMVTPPATQASLRSLWGRMRGLIAFWAIILTCFTTTSFAQVVTWNVGNLAPSGGSATMMITTTVDAGTAGQTITNIVALTGGSSDATPDNDTLSAAILVSDPEIGLAKMAEVDGLDVDLIFTIQNSGNIDVHTLELIDDLDVVFGAGNYMVTAVNSSTGNLHNPAYTGSAPNDNAASMSPTILLPAGETQTITVSLTVSDVTDQGNGAGVYYNNADITAETGTGLITSDASSDGDTPDPDVASPTPIIVEVADRLLVTKRTNTQTASIGDFVDFTLTVENPTNFPSVPAILRDVLPVGLNYMPKSATVNGTEDTPKISGNRLSWDVPSLDPGEVVKVQFFTVVTGNASFGTLTNRARALSTSGAALSDEATASVIIEPDAVFDCSDIMGRVYTDSNRDGHYGGNERGVPGIVLMTVNGLEITTGTQGRFFIPCAEVPNAVRGSNFILKLDERTLPPGYYVTTENPRVVRVTRGKAGKLGFGIAKAPIVDVRLNDASFTAGKATMPASAVHYIDQLLQAVSVKEHTMLRVAYYAREEDLRLVKTRMDAFKAYFLTQWRKRNLGKEPRIEMMHVVAGAVPSNVPQAAVPAMQERQVAPGSATFPRGIKSFDAR